MRIYDDRYSRERLRFHVALRFIRFEARTRTIRLWTGLSDDRIRKLYRSYLAEAGGRALPRHRGRSPQRIALFVRSPRLRQESALLASLYRLLGALASGTAGSAQPLPSPRHGELLCEAYEAYRSLVAEPLLGFEHAVFLFLALARGEELRCECCRDCRALIVVDRCALQTPLCAVCTALPASGAFSGVHAPGGEPARGTRALAI